MTAPVTVREDYQAMEFSVSKSALLNELSTTQGVVERKTTIPILSNLLVEAKGSHLNITATDLELSIRTSCEAKVKKEGAGTIPAKKLLELVRLLPEGEIKVKLLENHWVEIVSDRKKYKLVGMAKENFPALPVMPHTLVKISAPVMESLIAKTKFAISMEDGQGKFSGSARDAAHAGQDLCSGDGKPDRKNEICNFHGRVALHAERRAADFEAGLAGDGGHGRSPPGAG